MVKFGLWEAKFKSTKKAFGFLLPSFPKWEQNSMTTKTDLAQQLKNLKHTSKEYKNSCQKILASTTKFEMLKRRFAYQLVK